MGNPIEPTDPPWEGCPDCEVFLPGALFYVFTHPLTGVWSGIVTQHAIDLCNFAGVLWKGPLQTGGIIQFCDNFTDTVTLAVPQFLGTGGFAEVLNNHCYPFIDVAGNAPGANHKVWP